MADLHHRGVISVMQTGDDAATAASIAKETGIDDARGNFLPEDKLAAIEDLQRRTRLGSCRHRRGDGGGGHGYGDGSGRRGRHERRPAAHSRNHCLFRRTHAAPWQNIGLALGIKAIFLGLAVFDNATMWMAMFADMSASLLVVGNGVRILRWTSNKDDR